VSRQCEILPSIGVRRLLTLYILIFSQSSLHLATRFQRRFFLNNPPMVAMFVSGSGRNEHPYRGPSIDASYQVSIHLAKLFQRSFLKSAIQKQDLPVAAMFVNRSEPNVQSLERTLYRCFLPTFSLFG
jgi:hypothetical protein